MKPSAPKVITWWISLVLGAIGILAKLVFIQGLSGIAFWLVIAGFILLILGTSLKGL